MCTNCIIAGAGDVILVERCLLASSETTGEANAPGPLLLIAAADVRELLDPNLVSPRRARFRLLGEGRRSAGALRPHVDGGTFHLKAASSRMGRQAWFAVQDECELPGNPQQRGIADGAGAVL